MMDSVLNCGTTGWLMIACGALSYGVLLLAGAALIKYLVFGGRSQATAPPSATV